MALDSYFANPELYCREPKISVDRKKLDHVYSKYKGKNIYDQLLKVGLSCVQTLIIYHDSKLVEVNKMFQANLLTFLEASL